MQSTPTNRQTVNTVPVTVPVAQGTTAVQPQVIAQQPRKLKVTLSMDETTRRFNGRYDYGLTQAVTENEFISALNRLNSTFRSAYRRKSRAMKALPVICLPLGILLIVLALVQDQVAYVIAGSVLVIAGGLAGFIISASAGIVLIPMGALVILLPVVNEPWVFYLLGAMFCVVGVIGILAFAFRERGMSYRIMIICLPIGAVLCASPSQELGPEPAIIVTGVIITILGFLGAIVYFFQDDFQYRRAVSQIEFLVSRLNNEYEGRALWTFVKADPPKDKMASNWKKMRIAALQVTCEAIVHYKANMQAIPMGMAGTNQPNHISINVQGGANQTQAQRAQPMTPPNTPALNRATAGQSHGL